MVHLGARGGGSGRGGCRGNDGENGNETERRHDQREQPEHSPGRLELEVLLYCWEHVPLAFLAQSAWRPEPNLLVVNMSRRYVAVGARARGYRLKGCRC